MYIRAKKLSSNILPAILEIDPKKQIQRMEELSRFSNILHIDIMDGKFVRANNLKAFSSLSCDGGTGRDLSLLELHLMARDPAQLIPSIRKIKNVKRIVVHMESDWEPAVKRLRDEYQVGIAVKPETSLQRVSALLKTTTTNFILLLSATPGAQGNPFRTEIYRRVKEIRQLFPDMPIEIDGGMNVRRVRALRKLGATDFVVGSYLKRGRGAQKISALQKVATEDL